MIIIAISMIMWTIPITLLCAGKACDNDDLFGTGIGMLMAVLLLHAAFQMGADWQREYTNETYQLVKKIP